MRLQIQFLRLQCDKIGEVRGVRQQESIRCRGVMANQLNFSANSRNRIFMKERASLFFQARG